MRMAYKIRKLLFNLIFNLSLFSLVFLVSQNSQKKSNIYFLTLKSVEIPVGFILGLSFVVGYSTGSSLLICCEPSKNKLNG